MRRLLVILAVAGSVFFGAITGSSGKLPSVHIPTKNQTTPVVTSDPTAAPTPTPIQPAQPRLFQIPTIGINAVVQPVGMDSEGKMGVPNGWNGVVGWYDLGFIPGTKGSAVIDGHYDDPNGQPAVFWNIKNLQPGDQIIVTDNNNQQYTFVVTDVVSYPYDGAPLQQIFNTTDKPRLNLITCAGTWDRAAHNYSNRVVVYSVLQGQQ